MTVPLPSKDDEDWIDWGQFVQQRITTAIDGKAAASHTHPVSEINAAGTRSSSTFLRGDGTWASPPTDSGASVTDATTTTKGIVELATTAETTTGTDTVRAVTPAGVKAVADTKASTSHTHTAAQVGAVQAVTAGLKAWGGVKSQYDALATKASDTLYFTTAG